MDSKEAIRKALARALVIHNWSEPAAEDFIALLEQLLSVQPAQETRVPCEYCGGKKWFGEIPCSACNAMGETTRSNREPDHG